MRFETSENLEALVLLKKYRIYDWYYSRSLYESESVNSSEWDEAKELLGQLGKITGRLMKILIKIGKRDAVRICVDAAKTIYKKTKDTGETTKYLFYALLFFAVGYIGNSFKEKYNSSPVVPGTQIEYREIDGKRTMVVTNKKGKKFFVSQDDVSSPPSVVREKPNEAKTDEKECPITLIEKGQRKTSFYKASPEMIKAIAEVEHFVDHIYDAKSGSTKQITKAQLLDPKVDATIGYGHKLTPAERKAWSFNRKITKEDALKLFEKDLYEVEKILNANLKKLPYDSKVEYSQGLIDGLTSLLYNMGSGNTYGNARRPMSELWKRLYKCRVDDKDGVNVRDVYYAISQARHQNITARGHVFRREAECKIMQQTGDKVDPKLYHLKNG